MVMDLPFFFLHARKTGSRAGFKTVERGTQILQLREEARENAEKHLNICKISINVASQVFMGQQDAFDPIRPDLRRTTGSKPGNGLLENQQFRGPVSRGGEIINDSPFT